MYLPKRDTMHLRNNSVFMVLGCLLLVGSVLSSAQGQQNQGASSATPGSVQATPLPSDIDPSDPALPVWMKPATAPAPKTSANTPPSRTTGNVPPNQQPH